MSVTVTTAAPAVLAKITLPWLPPVPAEPACRTTSPPLCPLAASWPEMMKSAPAAVLVGLVRIKSASPPNAMMFVSEVIRGVCTNVVAYNAGPLTLTDADTVLATTVPSVVTLLVPVLMDPVTIGNRISTWVSETVTPRVPWAPARTALPAVPPLDCPPCKMTSPPLEEPDPACPAMMKSVPAPDECGVRARVNGTSAEPICSSLSALNSFGTTTVSDATTWVTVALVLLMLPSVVTVLSPALIAEVVIVWWTATNAPETSITGTPAASAIITWPSGALLEPALPAIRLMSPPAPEEPPFWPRIKKSPASPTVASTRFIVKD